MLAGSFSAGLALKQQTRLPCAFLFLIESLTLLTEDLTRKKRWTKILPKSKAKKPMSASRSKDSRFAAEKMTSEDEGDLIIAAEKMTSESTSTTVVISLKMSSWRKSGSSVGLYVARYQTWTVELIIITVI